ncbi:hypothetical protein GCM10023196_066170 [Actinoallomurus vinaceus]|uniref:Uncharacterized protein n=2 Tax=Actinoallomurus vinaceus TaxID=1080074 RepID=A0ABP8UL07_9ACTN
MDTEASAADSRTGLNSGDDLRIQLATALGTVILSAGTLLAAPAAGAADYPVSTFDVTVGNTYTRGTITWYNRSVVVAGEHKSVDQNYCRGTSAFALAANGEELARGYSDDNVCGTSAKFSFTVTTYAPGGPAIVRVCLDDGAKTPPVTYLRCERYGR